MSAYLVDYDTIDLVVSAAEYLCRQSATVRFSFRADTLRAPDGSTEPGGAESLLYNRPTVAAVLAAENSASVAYRYAHHTDTPITAAVWARAYQFQPINMATLPDAVRWPTVLKSVRCLQYQSCERPDYDASAASQLLTAIATLVVDAIVFDQRLPWGYTRGCSLPDPDPPTAPDTAPTPEEEQTS